MRAGGETGRRPIACAGGWPGRSDPRGRIWAVVREADIKAARGLGPRSKATGGRARRVVRAGVTADPTPIPISRRTRTALILAGLVVLGVVALTVSPTRAVLTALLYLGIQQLEGNFLTPKIQGDTLRLHPILVLLAVIVGGGLAGIAGVIVAVPSLAVLRVLFDFFRVRLKTES
jgi:hypothetical protein